MKLKSMLRSATAFVLAAAMIFGTCVTAFADTVKAADDTINYVALGASNVNGYGMDGYRKEDGTNVYGYKQIVEKAYPAIFADALAQEKGKEVNLTQLGISSFRAEEIHVMLDDNYDGDDYTDWRFHDGGQEWFKAAAAADGSYSGSAVDHLRDEFQNAVTEADVLSMDIGMNNFGVYVSQRTFDYLQGVEPSFGAELDPELKAKYLADLEAMRDEIITLVGMDIFSTGDALVEYLVKTIQYAYVGFVENFEASLGHIYEMNEDVNVVIVGMYNTMDGIMLKYAEGVTLPAGQMIDIILKYANEHMQSKSAYVDRYTYVDSSDRHNFYHQLTEDGKSYADLSDECKRVMYEYSLPYAQSAIAENASILEMLGKDDEVEMTNYIADVLVKVFTKALSNPVLDKNSLANLDVDAFKEQVVECITDAVTNGFVMSDDTYEPKMEFLDEEPYSTVGFFWCRFFFEDWFYIHPDEEGHNDAAVQMIDAYTEAYPDQEPEQPENPDVPTVEFSDVAEDAWYYNAVQWAAEEGITAGYEDGTFRPEASSTRAHVVMFLWNKMGKPAPTATENPFPDVAEDAWYYNAVLWAAEEGITAGYEDGTFRPEDICTRAHVVKFLWNLAGEPAPKATENSFSDVNEGKWYYDAVLWAAEEGISVGYEDGTFRPEKECTRAEIVQLLYAAYK